MKTLFAVLAAVSIIAVQSGCAAKATIGNHDQHGAGVSAKTKGEQKGVSATVY